MIYILSVAYFITFSVFLRIIKPIDIKTFSFGVLCLFALCSVYSLNASTGFVEEKIASFVSYDMHRGGSFQITFLFQYILAWIPLELTNNEYVAHGLNIGLQAFIFMIAVKYIFGFRFSWLLLAFMLFPSYYHYSIFGLRDPLINLVATLLVLSAIKYNKKGFFIACMALSFLTIGIRPEFSIIILGFVFVREFIESNGKRKIFIGVSGFAALYGFLLVMPIAFGLSGSSNIIQNIELMTEFNELRNARRLGEYGSGSHMLSGSLFSYPFLIRYPLQVLGSFLAPLPVDIRGSVDILAFLESLLFCFVVLIAAFKHRYNKTANFLFWCGILYMFLQAIFAINYGNILRVRYPIYIFFLASIASSAVLEINKIPKLNKLRKTYS